MPLVTQLAGPILRHSETFIEVLRKCRTRMTVVALSCLVMPSCDSNSRVLIDHTIPHRLAEPATVVIEARRPDGTFTQMEMEAPKGYWIASPQIVEQVENK